MKILFINPTIRENMPPYNFPIGMGILAAIVRDLGHEVIVYDQNALRTSVSEMLVHIRLYSNIDVVAVGGLVTTKNDSGPQGSISTCQNCFGGGDDG